MIDEGQSSSKAENDAVDPVVASLSKGGDADAERRAILGRLGKMAVLTAGSAVITLMLSTRKSAASPF